MYHERREWTAYARSAAPAMLLALGASCSAGVQGDGASTAAAPPDEAGTAADASSDGGTGGSSRDGTASDSFDAGSDGAPREDTAAPPSVSSTPPFDWVGIVGTGQSLGVGGGFNSQAISTTQPSTRLYGGGVPRFFW